MTTQTDIIRERITITSYAGNAWIKYAPDTDAGVYFRASWLDIVRGEQAPITGEAHVYHEVTAVYPVSSDRLSLATHITINDLPAVVTLAQDEAIDRVAVINEWIKFCDEVVETAAFECDCEEADLTVEELATAMGNTWRATAEDVERAAAVDAAA